jgi:predicted nucleotidyltransferase
VGKWLSVEGEKEHDGIMNMKEAATVVREEMSNVTRERLGGIVEEQPYPLLFATISGAHLYGFPSPDSDYDLRGVHVLPLRDVIRLKPSRELETLTVSGEVEGLEMDLVTHDVRKFFNLLLKKNGYVLEQLYSPLVVFTTPEHEELKAIAGHAITRHHSHHYLGFSVSQWRLFNKQSPRRVKPLLYVYRVLLTGIHLMRSGEVEANLVRLNQEFKLPYIDDLVQRKRSGPEKSALGEADVADVADVAFHEAQYNRLRAQLEQASIASKLPEAPSCQTAMDDLLVRVRLRVQP